MPKPYLYKDEVIEIAKSVFADYDLKRANYDIILMSSHWDFTVDFVVDYLVDDGFLSNYDLQSNYQETFLDTLEDGGVFDDLEDVFDKSGYDIAFDKSWVWNAGGADILTLQFTLNTL